MDSDIEEMRSQFLNEDFDEVTFEIDGEQFRQYAVACGETDPKYTDNSAADFQAPPTFVSTLVGGRVLPENLPVKGVGMDAGKGVEWKAPVKAGATLTGRSHLHDIYTKTGRSGRMFFFVTRMELFDADGTHVANADTRTVIREKPSE